MPKLPGINHQKAVQAFKKAGFKIVRQSKHIAMTNDDRIIIIPRANPINASNWINQLFNVHCSLIKTPEKKIAKPIINSHNKKGNQPIPL
jgi:predicted RNA binding protein YcfA (HicA-like mRNA interferase family)